MKPGYQKLCGQDSLDYVRYRHEDNDIVRAARQQDFLRQVKQQIGITQALRAARGTCSRSSATTRAPTSVAARVLRLLKLVLASAQHPIREIHFNG